MVCITQREIFGVHNEIVIACVSIPKRPIDDIQIQIETNTFCSNCFSFFKIDKFRMKKKHMLTLTLVKLREIERPAHIFSLRKPFKKVELEMAARLCASYPLQSNWCRSFFPYRACVSEEAQKTLQIPICGGFVIKSLLLDTAHCCAPLAD